VHFHAYPILSRTSQDKVRVLAARLTECQLRTRLYLVPFGGLQQHVVVAVPPALRVVVYRRLMMRIAERLAERSGARALITGDSVGQVASQTIDNLAVTGSVVTLPILRPLVGMDKAEITRDAERLGTYSTSIIPDDDCCTLFTPPHPATRASRLSVEAAEAQLDVGALVERALAETAVEDLRFPMLRFSTPNQRTRAGERQ
jgi:thiamine biosynthesis protein ThiI